MNSDSPATPEQLGDAVSAIGAIATIGTDYVLLGIDQINDAIADALAHSENYTEEELAVLEDASGHLGDYRAEIATLQEEFGAASTEAELLAAFGKFDDIKDAIAEKADAAADKLDEAKDRAASKAREAVDTISDRAGDAKDKLGKVAQTAKVAATGDTGRKNIAKGLDLLGEGAELAGDVLGTVVPGAGLAGKVAGTLIKGVARVVEP